ncbi:MAG: glycosyltransferase [Candidatus Tectimicrobiota bacterium]
MNLPRAKDQSQTAETRHDTAVVFMVINADVKHGVPTIPPFVTSQAESLRTLGWHVSLGVIDDRTTPGGVLRNIKRLRQERAGASRGLVHAQYGSVTAAVAQLIRGQWPLVVSFCGDDLLGTPNPGLLWRVRERLARQAGIWGARHAATLIVKSENLRQALPDTLQSQAIVLPNGVNDGWFQPLNQQVCRQRLQWPPETKVVLFYGGAGSNQAVKNAALAHATMQVLSSIIPDVRLHTMSQASREEVLWMLNAADCLLVTSYHEGSPNIVKEAMACNLPIVSVPCGDVVERLRGVHPGGVTAYDASALAHLITEVLRAGRRSNGREQLRAQGLTLEAVAQQLSHIYAKVLSQARK